MSKYKLTFPTHTLETDDVEIIRELCGLSKVVEVSVDTPNESIDPEWNKFLDEMVKKSKQQPTSPSSNPPIGLPLDNPFVNPYNPNDNWRQTFPRDYTHMQDPLFPQVTITC